VLARTLLLGSLLCAAVAVPLVIQYRAEVDRTRERTEVGVAEKVDLICQTIEQEVAAVLSDVRYLSQQNELRDVLDEGNAPQLDRLAREHLAFLAQKRRYDQVRVIGTDGRERVRVNYEQGRPRVVPPEELQDKGQRYYFVETMRLPEGQMYVSPFDLNIEQERVEQPIKPMIRFAVPLFNRAGGRRGVLVLNYLGEHIIRRAEAIGRGVQGDLWLLNPEGYWMIGPRGDEWAFMYPAGEDRTLAARDPWVWQRLSGDEAGTLDLPGGWLRYRRVYPLSADYAAAIASGLAVPATPESLYWTVAVMVPRAALEAPATALRRGRALGLGAIAVVVFAMSAVLAYVSLRGRALARMMARVLDHVPDLISYVDRDQRYRFNNGAYERYFGVRPRDLQGRAVREVVGESAYARIRPHVEQALAGTPVAFQDRIGYRHSGERDVAVTYVPDVGADGTVQGFLAIVSDVTRMKEAERRDRERMLDLAHVARLNTLGELATHIAHEVNQPLAAITTYCAASLRVLEGMRCEEDRSLRDWLHAIDFEARRVSDIIRRLREFVRRGDGHPVTLNLNEVVREVAYMVRGEVQGGGVDLDLRLARDLPTVVADRILIEQVVMNLLRNALEAVAGMPEDRRQIAVETAQRGADVEVSVRDSGPGIPTELGGRVFDSFVTSKTGGLGMGLAISRSIVEAHEGRLEYTNNADGGVTFRLRLPGAPS
jgi:PAS domain S-box-containing protein